MTNQLYIPFQGFYCSVHDEQIDHEFEQLFYSQLLGDVSTYAPDLYNKLDVHWSVLRGLYARAYVEGFNEEFDLKLEFVELDSPREYNYATDRILCTISNDDIQKLFAATTLEHLTAHIKDRCTSYNGFMSYYPESIKDTDHENSFVKPLVEWDSIQLQLLCESVVASSGDWDSMAEYALMESFSSNGGYYEIISKAVPKLQRYLDLNEKLIARYNPALVEAS